MACVAVVFVGLVHQGKTAFRQHQKVHRYSATRSGLRLLIRGADQGDSGKEKPPFLRRFPRHFQWSQRNQIRAAMPGRFAVKSHDQLENCVGLNTALDASRIALEQTRTASGSILDFGETLGSVEPLATPSRLGMLSKHAAGALTLVTPPEAAAVALPCLEHKESSLLISNGQRGGG